MTWTSARSVTETGIDLRKMVDTSVWLAGKLGRPSPSRPSPVDDAAGRVVRHYIPP